MKPKNLTALLGGLSAVLMSIPFIVPHCGWTALFGLVPLLCMEKIGTEAGLRGMNLRIYGVLVLWNALTTFWVCNATVGGGIFAVLANALQMAVIFALFRVSRKVFRGSVPYLFLAAMWIAWERFYFSAQISWPWLTLGNAFARTLTLAQWYEYTGALGGSLWVWACNLGLFGLMVSLADGRFFRWNGKAKAVSLLGCAAVLFAPMVLSAVIWNRYEETDEPLEVLIVQPNIDPYHKFQALSQGAQNAIVEGQIRKALQDRLHDSTASRLLILVPETFTADVTTNHIPESGTWRKFTELMKEYPGTSMLFGASSHTYSTGPRPSWNARPARWPVPEEAPASEMRPVKYDSGWVTAHNSALMADGDGSTEIFHKSKLVVGVEMTPWPAFFTKIDDLLGGVMGRCVGQEEITLLHAGEIPLGCAVCYESVYGEYCTGYVRKGARLLTVITNDAWWGDTPGYRQHLSYSSLRAIETRRDIARCANTGISALIDQRGRILRQTPWWEMATIRGTVNLSDRETFFVRNGDITGRLCTLVFGLLFLALIIRAVIPKEFRK